MKIDVYNDKVKDSGGNAFPFVAGQDVWPGMTLRDYFAGQAIEPCGITTIDNEDADIIAENAYRIADAMLKQRSKK